jgi:hypothetical protein
MSEVFRGESSGFKRTKGGDLEVVFGVIRIGTINPTVTLIAAIQN